MMLEKIVGLMERLSSHTEHPSETENSNTIHTVAYTIWREDLQKTNSWINPILGFIMLIMKNATWEVRRALVGEGCIK